VKFGTGYDTQLLRPAQCHDNRSN